MAGLGIELGFVLVEPGLEASEVGRAAGAVANRVEKKRRLNTERLEPGGLECDQLGVDGRVLAADRLDVELPELAEAALLRLGVAEHRRHHPGLDRLRLALQAVLDIGATNLGSGFGTKRERALAAIFEGVHLLGDDVGGLARAAREQLGLLEGRGDDAPVAVGVAKSLGLVQHPLPARPLAR